MLFKNKNARAVLATALAVITIFVLTFSVSAYECGNDTIGCVDSDNDGFCDYCGSDGAEHYCETYSNGTFDATCTEGGGYYDVCILCGKEYTYYTSDPLGHSYENGVCTACGDTDPDAGGDSDPDVGGGTDPDVGGDTDPDVGGDVECSHLGTSTIVSYEDEKVHNARCDDCGAIFYEAHTYENGVCPCGKTGVCVGNHAWPEEPQIWVEPTDHQEGYYQRICQRCGEYAEKTILPSNHMTQKATVPATCTKEGYIVYTCMEGCDYEYKETLPALGGSHSWSDWKAGLIDGCNRHYSRSCSVCGASDTKVEKVHYFNGGATICACGEKKCNHDWAGSNVLSTPTCTTAGVTEYWCVSCQNNGYIADKVERIEAFGHGDTYWKSTGNDSCFEYCGRCNVRVDVMNHFGSSDPATPCVKEYSATQIISGHYCDRCNTYIYTQESKIALENVLVVTIDENYGTRQQFDYDAFMSYKYIYIENKRAEYVSSFTFEVRSAKNMSMRFDAILNYIINGNDSILIDIENEKIYSHEKKHRVETVTFTGYEQWSQSEDIYSLDSAKGFDKYWKGDGFPEDSVMTALVDTSVHGNLKVTYDYTQYRPAMMIVRNYVLRPVRVFGYKTDFSTFLENLKKSPIKVTVEYDEQTVKQFDGSALQFFRTLKADHNSSMSSNEYAQGFNDAIQSVINENPVQGFFQGIWSSVMLFVTILGTGISIGGITLSGVISTAVIVLVAYFVIKVVR